MVSGSVNRKWVESQAVKLFPHWDQTLHQKGHYEREKGVVECEKEKLNTHTMRSYESLPLLIKNKADDGGRRAGKLNVLGQ